MKEITVDAMIENMNTVTAFVDDFLDQIACPMKSRIQINIVIDEIFGNICHYAYKDSVGAVTVRVESGNTPKAVFLTFTDNGIPIIRWKQKILILLYLQKKERSAVWAFTWSRRTWMK